jgi:hypothetical protein
MHCVISPDFIGENLTFLVTYSNIFSSYQTLLPIQLMSWLLIWLFFSPTHLTFTSANVPPTLVHLGLYSRECHFTPENTSRRSTPPSLSNHRRPSHNKAGNLQIHISLNF